MCLYSDLNKKQKELATKFKDHLEKKYGKKATLQEAHLWLNRLTEYFILLAKMKRDQEARGIFLDDEDAQEAGEVD